MSLSDTGIEPGKITKPSTPRRNPNDVLTAQAQPRENATEWRMVRTGLGLMAGSLTAFAACGLGAMLVVRFGPQPESLPLSVAFQLGLLLSIVGFLAGVPLPLLVPRQPKFGGWIVLQAAGLVGGVLLLFAAVQWRVMGREILGGVWKPGTRVLAWSAVAALLISHLGYCLHLGGVARRFGRRSHARWYVGCCLFLALGMGLVALDEAAFIDLTPPWIPLVLQFHPLRLMDWTAGLFLGLAASWAVLLCRLWRLVPGDETDAGPCQG